MNNKVKTIISYVAALVLLLFLTSLMFTMNKEEVVPLKYYEVLGMFEKGEVESYTLDLGTGDLKLVKKPEEGKEKGETIEYTVPNVSVFLGDIDIINEQNGYSATQMQPDYLPIKETPWWVAMLPTLLLIGAMAVFWFFMMRQQGGGGKVMDFAKAKYKDKNGNKPTTFADVAGCTEEKEELEEIVEFLKHPNQFNALGARIPKGVLLMGQPGTGKTLLARAVAGEAGVPFFSISGSDFVEMFVGVGASRVRDLFGEAKKNAPAIIFIDEIDAVGRHRGAGLGGGHDEREQTLNQLLVEMDGFGNNTGIIVMAATNRADILDPALLRPGRFDRQIVVGAPDVEGREAILKIHTKNKPLGPDVDLGVIAKSTAGFTGAELENLANEAALLAARRKKKAITMKEIEEATIKVVAGPEKKSKKVNEKDKRLTSYHEAGHAVVTYFCETQDPVHEISIVPRGYAGGYTMSLPVEDRNYVTKRYMEEELCTLLGGRVAEAIVLGDISTGASNDLERATRIARNMVTRYGFSEKLGPIVYGSDENEVFLGRDYGQNKHYSDDIASDIDSEIRRLVDEAYERTESILNEHRDKLDAVAAVLMEKEKVTGKEFEDIMNPKPAIEEPETAAPVLEEAPAEEAPEQTEE
ncbi:MAG: ATP-dependent zinc metalloprotease FtsH [Oscillospiraceae bacterium]|nr:ATP-dependent zinc metalloprotease FtsH [Oscillospiraceae bacterium]MBQ3561774.1 ATP-dependent zinc metalloprotease FtsH [Oscillospiraceae bacterium]MBQ4118632.1 ATP-dependent zinc metalloprotease FtsH [Oscillospiraceae bacterium]